jgi:hypothetical protein
VGMAAMLRSAGVAAVGVLARSVERRGEVKAWERAWIRIRMGTAERMTRVRE